MCKSTERKVTERSDIVGEMYFHVIIHQPTGSLVAAQLSYWPSPPLGRLCYPGT